MTLNITVLTQRTIYQSADYRLTYRRGPAQSYEDFQTQKIFHVNGDGWLASVCFAGVGATPTLAVADWLDGCVDAAEFATSFDDFVETLRGADSWLSTLSPPSMHSFSVGAFVSGVPVFVLISNYEKRPGVLHPKVRDRLSVYREAVTRPRVHVSGQPINRIERTYLKRLARLSTEQGDMGRALQATNAAVAKRNSTVSDACLVAHLSNTGDFGSYLGSSNEVMFVPEKLLPAPAREVLMALIREKFPEGARLVSISGIATASSHGQHQALLSERPHDPAVHVNYGIFLQQSGDTTGAQQAYERAYELDPKCTSAIVNLANLELERGHPELAQRLYLSVLALDPANRFAAVQVAARYLHTGHLGAAEQLVARARLAHPQDGPLSLLRAEILGHQGRFTEALPAFNEARSTGADPARVEAGYAFCLRRTNAPTGECIGAYRAARALRPSDGIVALRLAELLFLNDARSTEARALIQDAMKTPLLAPERLEALFYSLAYGPSNLSRTIQSMTPLVAEGARLRDPLAQHTGRSDCHGADHILLLQELAAALQVGTHPDALDATRAKWITS